MTEGTKGNGVDYLAERSQRDERAGFTVNAGGALQPKNLQEAMDLASYLCRSVFVPRDFQGNAGNVLAAVQMGAEVGLGPMAALQNIAVINGRPSIWGDAALAICKVHPEWGGIREEVTASGAKCTVKRIERTRAGNVESTVTHVFSKGDAETAKLWGKQGPWQQYPKRMMQMRARAFALRDQFPDALRGLSIGEESQDIVDVEAEVVTPAEAPTDDAPRKGAAGVKDRLSKRREPKPEPTPEPEAPAIPRDAEKWVGHCNTADSTDEMSAIRRDLDEVWGEMDEPTQKAITEALAAAAVRLAQE